MGLIGGYLAQFSFNFEKTQTFRWCASTIQSLPFFPIWHRHSTIAPLSATLAATQLDSNSEASDGVETMTSEECTAEEDVVFDLELEKASEKEQDIGRAVAKEMSNELVEAARPLVAERYASFVANLDDVVKKYNPDAEGDLKETWMTENYFTILKDFLHLKKNAFRHEIDFELLSDDDKQRADELHAKLQRDDEVAVKDAVQGAFNKYCEGLDDVQRQAFKTDEATSTLKDCWLPTHYISILSAYIDFEKDKFKPDACVASLSPEDKAKVGRGCFSAGRVDGVFHQHGCDAQKSWQHRERQSYMDDSTLCQRLGTVCECAAR